MVQKFSTKEIATAVGIGLCALVVVIAMIVYAHRDDAIHSEVSHEVMQLSIKLSDLDHAAKTGLLYPIRVPADNGPVQYVLHVVNDTKPGGSSQQQTAH